MLLLVARALQPAAAPGAGAGQQGQEQRLTLSGIVAMSGTK